MPDETETTPQPDLPASPTPDASVPDSPDTVAIEAPNINKLFKNLYKVVQPGAIGRTLVRDQANNNEPILILIARGPLACSAIDQMVEAVREKVAEMLRKVKR